MLNQDLGGNSAIIIVVQLHACCVLLFFKCKATALINLTWERSKQEQRCCVQAMQTSSLKHRAGGSQPEIREENWMMASWATLLLPGLWDGCIWRRTRDHIIRIPSDTLCLQSD